MNVQALREAIEVQKRDLGNGLLATDIYSSSDGQALVSYNSNPKACALFNRITNYMKTALEGSGFPGLRKYYLLDLAGDHMVVVIPMGDYQWGMLLNSKEVQLGLFLNVVLPRMIDAFEKAIAED